MDEQREMNALPGEGAVSRRAAEQLRFLWEVDKMKTVLRRTLIGDKSRRENDAEHSWHFALMALVLSEYADKQRVDLFRVLKMALVHDLVEIDAGDTFAYDERGKESQQQRETQAAERIFGLLPSDQGAELRALWEEFDAMQTPDAQYAAAIDRLQPFLSNAMTQGHTWRLGGVTVEQAYARMAMVKQGAPGLWPLVEAIVDDGVARGYLQRDGGLAIRPECPEDFRAVEELTRDAFWNLHVPGCDEHLVAHNLRASAMFIPELSFVALRGGRVVGNIMYSRAEIVDDSGAVRGVLTFGPLSVSPEQQRSGVGSALVVHSLEAARRLGYGGVVIFGDPAYYSRFGFRAAREFGIYSGDGVFPVAHQALELYEGGLDGVKGRFREDRAFRVDPHELELFEQSFPPKEKFVTESQRLFERLAGEVLPDPC